MDEDMTPERLHKLVSSAVDPSGAYRKQICKRLAHQIYNQFGVDGLLDLLGGIDDAGRFASVVVADRDEIDNYLYCEYGTFDKDIFDKVQMTEEWDDFIAETMDRAGTVLGKIVDDLVAKREY